MLYILPGMGTNNAMYEGPWRELSGVVYLNWPKLEKEISINEIAQRIIEENSIESSDWVGGSSLGGMVSLEISKILGNPQVILLGSAMHINEITPLLMKLAKFTHLTPVGFLQMISGSAPMRVSQVFANSDPDLIRKAGHALRKWEGGESTQAKILRIHGSRDLIIPCPKEAHIIHGGGHIIAMTHAEECVSIVKSAMEGGATTGSGTSP